MVQTPSFGANQPVLWGFGASFCKMGGLIAKPPILHKPCPLCGVGESWQRGRSRHRLETPFSEPLLETPFSEPCFTVKPTEKGPFLRTLPQNPSQNLLSQEPKKKEPQSQKIARTAPKSRGPPTTHHTHKRPSSSSGNFGGVVCELSEPKKKAKYAPPPVLHSRC